MIFKKNYFNFIKIVIGLSFSLLVTSCASQGVTSLNSEDNNTSELKEVNSEELEEGEYEIYVSLEGGSGKSTIESPAKLTVRDGKKEIILVWSSKNYDYMIVGGEKYLNENPGGQSTFTIPVESIDEPLSVIGDTTAMSQAHEIEYTIYFSLTEQAEEVFEDIIWDGEFNQYESIGGQSLTNTEKNCYANQFMIRRYGKYTLLSILNEGDYLIVPQEVECPDDVPEGIIVMQQPLDRTYLVSSSVMDLLCAIEASDNVILSGTKEKDWFIDEAKNAMKNKKMLYAGKYSAPDYELILSNGCNLAIENTMIYHKPEVKDKLVELGIPVMVERSSYENSPLGRLEWIKVYGALFNKEDEASKYFDEQIGLIEQTYQENKNISVAMFYVASNGNIVVRYPGDYITKMIEMTGGIYVPASVDEEAKKSSLNMNMEEFYVAAKDADILIYNSSIGGEIKSIDELLSKNKMFADFEAVKSGRVYCTSANFFQKSTSVAGFMQDLSRVYSGSEDKLEYLNLVE